MEICKSTKTVLKFTNESSVSTYSRSWSNVIEVDFTEEGLGAGSNFTICKRLRDLYNRVTVSNVIFDSPVGPEILASSPEGKFQTQIRITFNIYEDL